MEDETEGAELEHSDLQTKEVTPALEIDGQLDTDEKKKSKGISFKILKETS